MGQRRTAILIGTLALTAVALAGLPHNIPKPEPEPVAATAAVVSDRPAQRAARPGHWSVVVDGWYIELDQVAARQLPVLDLEPVEPPLLSPYDGLIGKYAAAAGIDWRLIAAIIYEESRFAPDSVSDAGAYGLMQVRAIAAREVGEENFVEPEANIRTGVRYLERLEREYRDARDYDRQALALAAYNMGAAHVQDAQALARRFGYDPLRWDGAMDVMVSLLEEPHVYDRLPSGFAQGRAVVGYVDRVLRRYAGYRQKLPVLPPGRIVQTAAAAQ